MRRTINLSKFLKVLDWVFWVLPFSPVSIPYVLKKAKEYNIELIPDWYKALSKDKDELE